jgi:putative ABC transport system permease protein
MLNVMFDVGDKVNQELKTYGANITVTPRGASLLGELYGLEEGEGVSGAYLNEEEIPKLKTIFWAFNIVDFAPYLSIGNNVTGVWFNKNLELPTGESVTTGIANMKSWWKIEGDWADDESNQVMIGSALAEKHGLKPGDSVGIRSDTFVVAGVFHAGSDEDNHMFISLDAAQKLAGKDGKVDRIEVSALTTPDNELSRRAARDPQSLSTKEWETWYCTAYVSAICYQIDEALTGSSSKPIRQVAESEGAILEKTELLMLLITVVSLAASALGISNLVTTSVMERAAEIGLLKAVGARDWQVIALVLCEVLFTAILGGAAGYGLGILFAKVIGHTVFGAAIAVKLQVIPLTAALVALVTLAGSVPALRLLLSLRPAEVLHGR